MNIFESQDLQKDPKLGVQQAEFMWHQVAHDTVLLQLERLQFYGRWCLALTIGIYAGFLVLMIGKLFA